MSFQWNFFLFVLFWNSFLINKYIVCCYPCWDSNESYFVVFLLFFIVVVVVVVFTVRPIMHKILQWSEIRNTVAIQRRFTTQYNAAATASERERRRAKERKNDFLPAREERSSDTRRNKIWKLSYDRHRTPLFRMCSSRMYKAFCTTNKIRRNRRVQVTLLELNIWMSYVAFTFLVLIVCVFSSYVYEIDCVYDMCMYCAWACRMRLCACAPTHTLARSPEYRFILYCTTH